MLRESSSLSGQSEHRGAAFVDHYDRGPYHEGLDNLTPADVYFGRGQAISKHQGWIKQKTIALRRRLHQTLAA